MKSIITGWTGGLRVFSKEDNSTTSNESSPIEQGCHLDLYQHNHHQPSSPSVSDPKPMTSKSSSRSSSITPPHHRIKSPRTLVNPNLRPLLCPSLASAVPSRPPNVPITFYNISTNFEPSPLHSMTFPAISLILAPGMPAVTPLKRCSCPHNFLAAVPSFPPPQKIKPKEAPDNWSLDILYFVQISLHLTLVQKIKPQGLLKIAACHLFAIWEWVSYSVILQSTDDIADSRLLAMLVSLHSTLVSKWVSRLAEFWTCIASRLASLFSSFVVYSFLDRVLFVEIFR